MNRSAVYECPVVDTTSIKNSTFGSDSGLGSRNETIEASQDSSSRLLSTYSTINGVAGGIGESNSISE